MGYFLLKYIYIIFRYFQEFIIFVSFFFQFFQKMLIFYDYIPTIFSNSISDAHSYQFLFNLTLEIKFLRITFSILITLNLISPHTFLTFATFPSFQIFFYKNKLISRILLIFSSKKIFTFFQNFFIIYSSSYITIIIYCNHLM